MNATVALGRDDLRGQIQAVLLKLDRIESRVKNVEGMTEIVPRLERKIAKVESRVEKRLADTKKAREPMYIPSAPLPVKAFVSGASMGLTIVGVLTAAWLLGFL